jgi:hypothetical protein
MRDIRVSVSRIMLKDCTKAPKANFSLSVAVIVDCFDIDKRTIVNMKIMSILEHCGDDSAGF